MVVNTNFIVAKSTKKQKKVLSGQKEKRNGR